MLKASVTYHVNECQQCQDEHAKSHQVLEIKQILVIFPLAHPHHPHSYVE
jgi:hypothetical protein